MEDLSAMDGRHRNYGCRLRAFVWQGFHCISMENANLRLVVCPDKGCDIVELTHKPTDTELLYQSPWGLGSPQDRHSGAVGGPFRDRFAGGWFLMLPNGPEPCAHHGAEFGHHGEASQLAWSSAIVADRAERIEVVFRVRLRRMPLGVERRISLVREGDGVTIVETVYNESGEELDVFWGHHPCLGEPFLDDGCTILLPDGQRSGIGGPVSDFRTFGAGNGLVTISNPRIGLDFLLSWDPSVFPVMGVWRAWDAGDGYPNYRSRRIIAVEPAVDFPSLAAAAVRGTALKLAPGEQKTTTLTARIIQKAKADRGVPAT